MSILPETTLKLIRTLAPILALGFAAIAHADTLYLGSYATTGSNPGVVNSSTSYSPFDSTVNNGSTATYSLNPGTTWHTALGTTSYVSYDPNTAPGGTYQTANGDYTYTSSFTLNSQQANIGIGTLTILADDTVSAYLNGTLLLAAAPPKGAGNSYATCSDFGPNCLTPVTFALSGLVEGNNIFTFDVKQVNLFSEGVDYSGSIVATVPEPASLALASTGLIGLAGMVRRRFNS